MKENYMSKKISENELVNLMNEKLIKNANNQETDNLESAVDYLNSAFDIFEDMGMAAQADKILNILYKIANVSKEDFHTKGLTPEKMVQNLKQHGTEFNMISDDQDINFDDDLSVNDSETFED
jgi:hypothetical protein